MSDDDVDDEYMDDPDDIDDEDYVPEAEGVRRSGRTRRSRAVFPTFVDIADHAELIEVVKEYDLLYNPKNQWYSDNLRKERAWKEISSIISIPDHQCKKAWANLRDGFRRSYKKRKEAADGQPVKPWKYDTEMEFLAPFMKVAEKAPEAFSFISTDTIDTTTAFNSDPEVQVEADDDIEEEVQTQFVSLDKPVFDTPKQPAKRQMIEDKNNEEEEEKQTNVRSREESDFQSPKQPVKRKKIQKQKEPEPIVIPQAKAPSPVTTMIPSSTTTTSTSSHDEIDMFFSCIAATVKQFSPLSKAMAKSRVFAVISEMEMMEISKNESK